MIIIIIFFKKNIKAVEVDLLFLKCHPPGNISFWCDLDLTKISLCNIINGSSLHLKQTVEFSQIKQSLLFIYDIRFSKFFQHQYICRLI